MLFSILPIAFAEAASRSVFLDFVPLILIFGIFYFVMVAPMRKRQKALTQMISELKKGDKVVTTGGLFGEVHTVQSDSVLLKVADNVRVKVTKSAIAGQQGSEDLGVGT